MRAAVADAVVKFAVGADREAVHVVAGEVKPHTVARAEVFARLGFVGAGESGETRDVGKVNRAPVREDTGGDAVDLGVKTIGI